MRQAGKDEELDLEKLLQEIPTGLFGWYQFCQGAKVLYVGHQDDVYALWLERNGIEYTVISLDGLQEANVEDNDAMQGSYDYVICVAEFEKSLNPEAVFAKLFLMQKREGVLLLGANNRYGLRYFCGDRDPYTERNFDGIESYKRAYSKAEDKFVGRAYSESELRNFLQNAGYAKLKFFSMLTDLQNPAMLFAEDYLPNEDLANRVFPTYFYPKTVFLEERNLYDGIIRNGMFHKMANAYLVECTVEGSLSDVKSVTASLERGNADALYTINHASKEVEKRAIYKEGIVRLQQLDCYLNHLRESGVRVIKGRLQDGNYYMPYETAPLGQVYLKELMRTDVQRFLDKMDQFRDLILASSEIVKEDAEDGEGAILRYGYPDMVPLNSFYKDDTFVFFDQEFREENYPANAIIFRMIATFYSGDPDANRYYPMEGLLERYHLKQNLKKWQQMEGSFLVALRKEKELSMYHARVRANGEEVNSNRQRMNYSVRDYQRLFVDIFDRADTRKLVLFGSGNYAKKFLTLFAKDYPVYAIVDNKKEKWGQELEGISIRSPELLRELKNGEYKVIICIKSYLSVMKQLDEMGVGDYSIYDWNRDYPRKLNPINAGVSHGETTPKRYHIGYVAGAFDMFHVGHLNLLRRAKELCDYLIVGVISDEEMETTKRKKPVIPEEDRLEIVSACRYVDHAEILHAGFAGISDAHKLFHFDVQFSGNDHVDDIGWRKEKEQLESLGADIVYFDYTQKVSSTMLRELIEN